MYCVLYSSEESSSSYVVVIMISSKFPCVALPVRDFSHSVRTISVGQAERFSKTTRVDSDQPCGNDDHGLIELFII